MAEKTVTLYLSGYDTSDYAYASASDLANPIGKPSSNGTCATIDLATGSKAATYIYYYFDTSSIPNNANIISISCTAKGYVSSTSSYYVSARQMQLFCGTTAKGSSVNLTTTATAHTIAAGTWTRDELNNCRLRLYAQRGTMSASTSRTMQLYGAELTITYDAPEIVPIIGSVAIGNIPKDLKGGHILVDGVLKPLVKSYANINNIWLPTFGYKETVYTWKKYTTVTATADGWAWSTAMYGVATTSSNASANVYDNRTPTFSVTYSNGEISEMTTSTYGMETRTAQEIYDGSFEYLQFINTDDWRMGGLIPKENLWYKSDGSKSSYGDTIEIKVYRPVYSQTTTYSQGSYIGDVTANTSKAYPTNGRHTDGFWYVFQG